MQDLLGIAAFGGIDAKRHGAGRLTPALERLVEVSLEGLTGPVVSFVILPSSAVGLVREQTTQVLESMAAAAVQLFSGVKRGLKQDEARE